MVFTREKSYTSHKNREEGFFTCDKNDTSNQGCLPFDRKIRLGCRKHNGKRFTSLRKNCHIRFVLNPKEGRICVA